MEWFSYSYTGISPHHQQHYIVSPSYEMQLMTQQCVVSAIDDLNESTRETWVL